MWVPPAIICGKNQRNYVAINLAAAATLRPSGPRVGTNPPDSQASSAATLNAPNPPSSPALLLCPPDFTQLKHCARGCLWITGRHSMNWQVGLGKREIPPVSRPGNQTRQGRGLSENFLLCGVFCFCFFLTQTECGCEQNKTYLLYIVCQLLGGCMEMWIYFF